MCLPVMVTMLFKVYMCYIVFVRRITFRYYIDVSLELVPQVEGLSTHECQKISWDRVSDECINSYAEATKCNLKIFNIPHDAIIFLQVLTGPFLAELGISASCASSVLIIDLRLCACV